VVSRQGFDKDLSLPPVFLLLIHKSSLL